jgi:hypothetical protein
MVREMRRRLLLLSAPLLAAAAWGGDTMPPAERSRVDRLIQYVESRTDVAFVRNGAAYSSKDAAAFLREKMGAMGGQVTTARQFIDLIATRSSMSGEPYTIRHPDGRTEPSAKFLHDELKRMDGTR